MVQERQKAEGDALREKRLVKDLEDKRREQIGRRAVNTMFRRRLARAFYALAEGVDARRARRERIRRVMVHISKGGMARAFEAWRQATAELKQKKDAARWDALLSASSGVPSNPLLPILVSINATRLNLKSLDDET